MPLLSKNTSLKKTLQSFLDDICRNEGLASDRIHSGVDKGEMVLLGNPYHTNVKPILIGQPARIKVNANIGTAPHKENMDDEIRKMEIALHAGADTIMDLSIAGDLFSLRQQMLDLCSAPLGTVPLYAVAQRYINANQDPADFSIDELLEEIERQAEQGVDFMTLHCGLTERGMSLATDKNRLIGIVSRGGAIMARWMRKHKKENPLLTHYDHILRCALKYNLTLSLGDSLRPGAGADAGDASQWDEIIMLGYLTAQAHKAGIQCMVEGPGHVPLNEIEAQIQTMKKICLGAPLYVLGPLVIDCAPGYDHIAGAIGGAVAVQAGADFLCYLTPAEHVALPDAEDVRMGVIASRIAAQAGEVALKRERALSKERRMSTARKNLDWEIMHQEALDPRRLCAKDVNYAKDEACSMCGKFCAVKMLR